ncbi:MAG TPA: DUF3016 domain-containing protein [Rhodanobacteraceae bacterium]
MLNARVAVFLSATFAAALLAGCATTAAPPSTTTSAPATATTVASPATSGPVDILFHDPHKFTENTQAGFGHGFDHDGYMENLRTFLVKKATPMLQPGEKLTITFTNIDLAGGYEPWRGPQLDNVRFMTNAYPPRFDFSFKLTGADGQIIHQGTRKLTDLSYLQDFSASINDSDPLRYDKALLMQWLRRGPAKW